MQQEISYEDTVRIKDRNVKRASISLFLQVLPFEEIESCRAEKTGKMGRKEGRRNMKKKRSI